MAFVAREKGISPIRRVDDVMSRLSSIFDDADGDGTRLPLIDVQESSSKQEKNR